MLAPGMRRTSQRTAVYQAIVRLGGHCTADEIAAELRKTKPGFSRSTVYRALDALTASGSVYAAHLGEGPTHYELASGDHQHAVCQVCGGVLHIQEEFVTELEQHLEHGHHFRPLRTEVLVVGICEDCSRFKGAPAKSRRSPGLRGDETPGKPAAPRRMLDAHHH